MILKKFWLSLFFINLDEFFKSDNTIENIQKAEDFYAQIDNYNLPENNDWVQDKSYPTVYENIKLQTKLSIVTHDTLIQSLKNNANWNTYFIAENPLSIFDKKMVNPCGVIFTSGRGTRTGQDDMYILDMKQAETHGIEKEFLKPILQSSRNLNSILYTPKSDNFIFICDKSETDLQQRSILASN